MRGGCVTVFFMREKIVERFLRYVKVDTRSDYESGTFPSTDKQWDLLRQLKNEVEELGLHDVELDSHGYLTASLPANAPAKGVPVVAFLAHVDTSPDVTGTDVKPTFHENYAGNDIVLPGDPEEVIRVDENPNLKRCKGHTLITTDGTTLLGADDKAGIAETLTAVEYLMNHPEIKHGPVRVAFTPDEEIGKGTLHFDVEKFGADYAYTVDGGDLGEIENETFTAASATVTVKGHNVHPGYAKDKMVNAVRVAGRLVDLLPKEMAPETTEKKEGYIHPNTFRGDVSEVTINLILRDFLMEGIEEKKTLIKEICDRVSAEWPKASIDVTFEDQYKNMVYKLNEEPRVVEYAMEAVRRIGLEPKLKFIRGGTDGAQLCFKGLLTPNIFAGGQNFHSKQEWVSVEWMEKATETIVNILQIWYEKTCAEA